MHFSGTATCACLPAYCSLAPSGGAAYYGSALRALQPNERPFLSSVYSGICLEYVSPVLLQARRNIWGMQGLVPTFLTYSVSTVIPLYCLHLTSDALKIKENTIVIHCTAVFTLIFNASDVNCCSKYNGIHVTLFYIGLL